MSTLLPRENYMRGFESHLSDLSTLRSLHVDDPLGNGDVPARMTSLCRPGQRGDYSFVCEHRSFASDPGHCINSRRSEARHIELDIC